MSSHPSAAPLAARTRELLRRYGLRPLKSLGQNFLIDPHLVGRIVRAAVETSPPLIVEIGAGLGALTVPLAQAGARIVAYEKDRRLEAPLREVCEDLPHVDVVIGDFLEADLTSVLQPGAVAVGNLPYYITSPILEKLFLSTPPFEAIIVTVQREVGDRLGAQPGTPEYGSLSVFCAYHTRSVERICRLSPGAFLPPPQVESVALRLHPRSAPPTGVVSPEHLFAVVRAAFGYRRKTLLRALATAPGMGLDDRAVREVLATAGVDPTRRGETLSLEEFAAIGNALATREVAP